MRHRRLRAPAARSALEAPTAGELAIRHASKGDVAINVFGYHLEDLPPPLRHRARRYAGSEAHHVL